MNADIELEIIDKDFFTEIIELSEELKKAKYNGR